MSDTNNFDSYEERNTSIFQNNPQQGKKEENVAETELELSSVELSSLVLPVVVPVCDAEEIKKKQTQSKRKTCGYWCLAISFYVIGFSCIAAFFVITIPRLKSSYEKNYYNH